MLKDDIRALPEKPGVYIMRNAQGEIIYVGKAKVLKNRVSQYFQNSKNQHPKVAAMVANIDHFEYIITDSEFEALVLECSLIKEHTPKYNILLKDDKAYPYIKITDEAFPRIQLARRVLKDGAKYYGPYMSLEAVEQVLNTIRSIFNVRTCSRNLPRDIGKARPCLNHHIKKCLAPCNGHVSQQEYAAIIEDAAAFIEGKHDAVAKRLTEQMEQASAALQFEKAAKLRDQLYAIDSIAQKQKVVSSTEDNQDIIAMAQIEKRICIQVFFGRGGKILGREHYFTVNDTDKEEILSAFIKEYYMMATTVPKTILVQFDFPDRELMERWLSEKCGYRIHITVPQRGEKFKIVQMVENNALETLKLDIMHKDINKKKIDDLLLHVKDLLGLEKVPMRIESYDISNISGTDSVGAYVVFENGAPKKSDYRKFNIRSVQGADDYSSMKETLYRRISNALDGEEKFLPLPDLILLDGGRGHVAAATEILEFFKVQVPMFGLVKDDKHRTRGVVTADAEIGVKRDSDVFKFFTRIQDEVHRYALGAHKAKRKKTVFRSELDDIKGVGEKKRTALLKVFKNVDQIRLATEEELAGVQGIDRRTAAAVYDHFHRTEQ